MTSQYRHGQAPEIPGLETADGKRRTRLVVGRLDQQPGSIVKTDPPFVAHATLAAAGAVELAPAGVDELAEYVLSYFLA